MGDSPVTDAALFRFKLTNETAGTVTVDQVVFQLSSVTGIVQGDFANLAIYVDDDNDGTIGAGETTEVGGSGTVDGSVTTITFGDNFNILASTTVNYIFKGDVSNLELDDTVTIDLGTSNVTLTSGNVGGNATTSVTHTYCGSGKFSYRRLITIDHTKVGTNDSGALPDTGFPVLVSLSEPWLMTTTADPVNGRIENSDGLDIVFRESDGETPLDFEIEEYDGTNGPNGTLVAWVRFDSLSKSADTTIYIYYGNACVNVDPADPDNVWDANYKGVWHLKEATDATNMDSTSNSNDGTPQNSPAAATGKISGALNFEDAAQTRVEVGTAGSLDLSLYANWSISAWVKPSTNYVNSKYPTIYAYGNYRATLDIAVEEGTEDGLIENYLNDSSGLYSDTAMNINAWNHVVVVRDPTTTYFYLNGVGDGSGSSVDIDQDNSGSFIGGWPGYSDGDLLGLIDEVRVSGTDRDADWIRTSFNNQSDTTIGDGYFIKSLGSEDTSFVTAITLLSFTATGRDGAVQVSWETARENHHLGFHVYRSTSAAGPFDRLTEQMIAGATFSAELKEYSFIDRTVSPGELYYYLLEDIDVSGTRTDHGPICVDWDADGLPDDWEIARGLNPGLDDADLDSDNDGLSNLEEYERGTDPFNADSDGDGIADGLDDGRLDRDGPGELRSLDRGVYVVASDENGVTLELRTDFFDSTVIRMGDQKFDRLHIADYVHGTTAAIGSPEMPLKGILVDIPADRSASLAIVATEVETHTGYRVYPVPENVADEQDEAARVSEVFVIDEEAYEQNSFYPNGAARLGQSYVFRDQSKQQVIFYPLAFNAATGQMILYTRIRVRINYGDQRLARADDAQPVPWKLPAAGPSNGISAFGLMAAVSGTSPILSSFIFSPILSIGLINAALWSPPGDSPPAVPAHKILLSEEGIYRLTCADLTGNGVAITDGDLSSIRIYHLGREVAIDVVDANGAVCDANDYIQFYAPAVSDQYTKYAKNNVFWLTTGSAAGAPLRMADIESTPPGRSGGCRDPRVYGTRRGRPGLLERHTGG